MLVLFFTSYEDLMFGSDDDDDDDKSFSKRKVLILLYLLVRREIVNTMIPDTAIVNHARGSQVHSCNSHFSIF